MHDIGKVAIPDAVLNKPAKLTEDEFMIMERHAQPPCEAGAVRFRIDRNSVALLL